LGPKLFGKGNFEGKRVYRMEIICTWENLLTNVVLCKHGWVQILVEREREFEEI
jgi:hypothetical protein